MKELSWLEVHLCTEKVTEIDALPSWLPKEWEAL
jgi:hypothetical protein